MITAETIGRIIGYHGGEMPVVSLYVAAGREGAPALPARLRGLLHEIRPLAWDGSLDRRARRSIRADIERLEGLDGFAGSGGLAVFCCSEGDLFERVPLPRPVRDRVMVAATPWARPLLAVLDEYHRTCVAVVDRRSAEIWELYQDEMTGLGRVEDQVPHGPGHLGRHGPAGDRVRNRADDPTRRHYRTTVRMLDQLFRAGDRELLVIGGRAEAVSCFACFLPHRLRARLAGTFEVDPRTATPADVRRGAEHVVERYERAEERRQVARVLDLAAAGRPAALGPADCLWAASVAAIHSLLVQEGATAAGVVCDESGWLAASGDTCPLCGRATRPAANVLGELADAVIDEGGTVEHVLADTELAGHLVAAELRFPLPPRPSPAAAASG
ncbi:hypothetical protein Sru01_38030 [Sphaerisporangium rufum]|uniref:Peptide chain release factor subunit 1 n=1 Tax=Sphaerisporangium rufum TaxID=1381558 RepID=A0A919UZ82_9ACTN|nr:hypothetical protein [Sphaerisporangium rufum]GII78821.1 hypothetical protein Sru01_38030 [Sphaerisporangium rufum]